MGWRVYNNNKKKLFRCPINVREIPKGAIIIKKGQSRETGNKTKKEKKTKTQYNICWTPLYGNKHK